MMCRIPAFVAVALAVALACPSSALAEGETDYDLAYCGGPHGSPAPRFSTLFDLPILFTNIGIYTLTPNKLYGPGPWTNWYRERDMRKALAKLATMRTILEDNNLWDTYLDGQYPEVPACPADAETTRTIDGTCNGLELPHMGARGARFGRNMNPESEAAQADPNLMSPNPREVSRILFTRDAPKEVPFLNMLAAAWIQFNVHDWFAHQNTSLAFHEIPLSEDDPLYHPVHRTTMRVPKTAPDPTRTAYEDTLGPTYPNQVTHWWDGSQLYGSDQATSDRLRSFEGGHLAVDPTGLLPVGADGFEDTGFRDNWWIGLGLMHNLFAREHNAIADMLAGAYPTWTDQEIFDKARMINAAVIVKIHTLEWTPAIIPNPTLEVGMNVNWFGLNKYLWPKLVKLPSYIPLPYRNVIFGVRGGPRELHENPETGDPTPFSLTEEFVSVYRMHTLLPDAIEIYDAGSGLALDVVPLADVREADARALEEDYGLDNLLYSFGVTHPGGLVLNNYPEILQNLSIPVLGPLDIGAVDILRDRERGIPRYNEFRRQLQLKPLASIDELTDDVVLREAMKDVYGHDADAIERVDLLVGSLAEGTRPTCYGFGETLFQVFTLMATRRLHADYFYTEGYTAAVYTQEGLDWIEAASMKSVLLRHFPELGGTGLADVTNAFYPWE
jgi:hypothetical protein